MLSAKFETYLMITVKNTVPTEKKLQDSDTIVRSLIALRDELYSTPCHGSNIGLEILWKINRCLYIDEKNELKD